MNLVQSIAITGAGGKVPIIAEIKRIIPHLSFTEKDDRDAGWLAMIYQRGGAAGVSLVTEARYFGGQPEKDLPLVLKDSSLPVLIKDFIIREKQVDYYYNLVKAVDGTAVARTTLLLISHLAKEALPSLLARTHELGMTALVETRSIADLAWLDRGDPPRLIGVNNKDIDRLEVGQDVLKINWGIIQQYRKKAGQAVIISQSAHHSAADIRYSIDAGADAVLVGTAVMTAADPEAAVAGFVNAFGGAK
ncbi:MAG: hypothetical protein GX550_00040 [Syntrophomonadaceae bacterium]|nr:hypothetical protein [Syntrophomonadaceae bacterium]